MTASERRNPLVDDLVLAALHLLIVSSLGAKLLYDRATCPRVWVETAPYDPEMPIRGRYVSLQLMIATADIPPPADDSQRWERHPVTLQVEGDRLVAHPNADGTVFREPTVRFVRRDGFWLPALGEPVAFFIPEHVADPSQRPEGGSLLVEVTIPRKGPPRPIRLGVRRDGVITPLALH